MEINLRHKIRSLFRRQQPFFCLSFDFQTHEIIVHQTHDSYFAEVVEHRDAGYIKRAELYAKETIEINAEEYLLYLISYGDFRRQKIVIGENPLAKGCGICLFDHVYVFVEQKSFAQRKMLLRMASLEEQGDYFNKNLLEESYSKHFGEEENSTDFCTSFRRNHPTNQSNSI